MAVANVNKLYEACRDGDISTIRRLAPLTSIKDLNSLESSDGRTCLHAAAIRGDRDSIRILLECGALRQIRDRDGKTAADVVKDEEAIEGLIRQPEKVAQRYAVDNHEYEQIDWLLGRDKAEAFSRAIHRGCVKDRGVAKTVKKIEHADFIPDNDESKEGKILRYFLNESREKNDPTYLIRAYTIDGIFYTEINRYMASGNSKEVFKKLCDKWSGYYAGCIMKNPAFQPYRFTGITYRGMVIDREDLNQYEVGVVLTNKAFQSSSKLTSVALRFAQQRQPTLGKVSVLIQYTIVNRNAALDIKTLSEFPEEEEVLMVPGILFKVDYVSINSDPYVIHLRQIRVD